MSTEDRKSKSPEWLSVDHSKSKTVATRKKKRNKKQDTNKKRKLDEWLSSSSEASDDDFFMDNVHSPIGKRIQPPEKVWKKEKKQQGGKRRSRHGKRR
jgi:hypothetical protein